VAKRIFHLIDRLALLATQQGGFASKPELVKTLTVASQQAFNAMTPAKAPRPVGPGLNRALDTRLHPFLREASYTKLPDPNPRPLGITTGGRFALPEPCYVDYYDIEGAEEVQEVVGQAWRQILADPIEGPDATHYKVRNVDSGDIKTPGRQISPVPETLVAIYYAYPTEPVYKEDYDTGAPVYNDDQSVDTGWGLEMEPELLVRSLRLLGLEIRDPQLQAVAAQLTAETI